MFTSYNGILRVTSTICFTHTSMSSLKRAHLIFCFCHEYLSYICCFVLVHTPTAEVDTNPVVFGSNVILKCKCKIDKVSDIHWLKGSNKNYLTDGNSSLCPDEYSTRLYQERGEYIYFLIIQKFVIANVDSYICEFGFNQGEITLTLNENMTCKYLLMVVLGFAVMLYMS